MNKLEVFSLVHSKMFIVNASLTQYMSPIGTICTKTRMYRELIYHLISMYHVIAGGIIRMGRRDLERSVLFLLF